MDYQLHSHTRLSFSSMIARFACIREVSSEVLIGSAMKGGMGLRETLLLHTQTATQLHNRFL